MNTLESFSWISTGSASANHLWQSTLFAFAAAALALVLKKNQARVRYWLWLAASIKFLLPFSVLVALGSHLRWSQPAPTAQANLSFVMEEMSQTFAPAALQMPAATHSSSYALAIRVLPVCLLMVWFAGFVTILLFWYLRWRRLRAIIVAATIANSGREVDALRRLESKAGIVRPTELVVSKSSLEPGIFGVFRPVMFLPAGIAERLSDSQLAAVVMHELCHLRCRDNLAAALHMLVEALFWFHPLVWWVGARLLDERERACDEEVLALGSEPQAYAEGILKVCEFYLATPLVCVAGITGSNLKKRIEAIMIHRMAHKLELGKKLLLATITAVAFIAPVVFGLFHPAQSLAQTEIVTRTFNSPSSSAQDQPSSMPSGSGGLQDVSIKPMVQAAGIVKERFAVLNDQANLTGTVHTFLKIAFGLNDAQLSGGPAWLNTDLYAVSAKVPKGASFIPEFQKLLTDHFKLALHRELKELPAYEMVVGPNGSKLTELQVQKNQRFMIAHNPLGHITGNGAKVKDLAGLIQFQVGRMVIDNTGLNGYYDFTLTVPNWTQPAKTPEDAAPFLKAVSEQLGLELKPTTKLTEVLVIDHAEPVTSEKKDFAESR